MPLDAIGSLFSNSWRRYEKRFWTLVSIYLPSIILLVIGEILFTQPSLPDILLGSFLLFLSVIVSIATGIGSLLSIDKGTNFAESYHEGFKLFWAWIWIAILLEVAIVGGFVLLIIPGIILSVQLVFAVYVLVLEEKHGMQALIQSREYVKGYWWALVGRWLLSLLILGALMLVICLPCLLLLGKIAGWFAYGIVFLFVGPFLICYLYEIFNNLRRLKPNAAEDAAKAKHEFLTVSMVIGIIGIIVSIVLFIGAIVFLPTILHKYAPTTTGTTQVSPSVGLVGTVVTISGMRHPNTTDTILMNSYVAASNVPLSASDTLTFTIPANLNQYCYPYTVVKMVCPKTVVPVVSKTYLISVPEDFTNVSYYPDTVGSFTVTTSTEETNIFGQPMQSSSSPVNNSPLTVVPFGIPFTIGLNQAAYIGANAGSNIAITLNSIDNHNYSIEPSYQGANITVSYCPLGGCAQSIAPTPITIALNHSSSSLYHYTYALTALTSNSATIIVTYSTSSCVPSSCWGHLGCNYYTCTDGSSTYTKFAY